MGCDDAPSNRRYRSANCPFPAFRFSLGAGPARNAQSASKATQSRTPKSSFQCLQVGQNVVHLLVSVVRQESFMLRAWILHFHRGVFTQERAIPTVCIVQGNPKFI